MPKYCPASGKDDCARGCKGFQCKNREDKPWTRLDQWRGHTITQPTTDPTIEKIVKDFFFDPAKPVHPGVQNDAWDEWKSNRDVA